MLTTARSISLVSELGVIPLSSRPPSHDFMRIQLQSSLDCMQEAWAFPHSVPDDCTKFHLHRVTSSVCRVQHILRLMPPDVPFPLATRFDERHMDAYQS